MINTRLDIKEFDNVTVIIPAYNEELRIGNVIQAIVANSYRVLVIDDGSIDNTTFSLMTKMAL